MHRRHYCVNILQLMRSTFLQISALVHSFIHSASSSPLLLRGAPDYSIDTASELVLF